MDIEWLRERNAELQAEVTNWDPSWGEYRREVAALEGQQQLMREHEEAIEKGDAA